MKLITCPRCRQQQRVHDPVKAQDMQCPACRHVFPYVPTAANPWQTRDVRCRPHPGASVSARLHLDEQGYVRRVDCPRLIERRLCSALGNQCLHYAAHGVGHKPLDQADQLAQSGD